MNRKRSAYLRKTTGSCKFMVGKMLLKWSVRPQVKAFSLTLCPK